MNYRFLVALPLIFFMTFIGGCATAPDRIANTTSGWPQVSIESKDSSYIHNWIVNRMANKGWSLESQSGNMLRFTKMADTGAFQTTLIQALLGNSYSTTPKFETNYSISTLSESTNVTVKIFVSTQMAMGQVNRVDLKNDNSIFNEVQRQLNQLKAETEAKAAREDAAKIQPTDADESLASQ